MTFIYVQLKCASSVHYTMSLSQIEGFCTIEMYSTDVQNLPILQLKRRSKQACKVSIPPMHEAYLKVVTSDGLNNIFNLDF